MIPDEPLKIVEHKTYVDQNGREIIAHIPLDNAAPIKYAAYLDIAGVPQRFLIGIKDAHSLAEAFNKREESLKKAYEAFMKSAEEHVRKEQSKLVIAKPGDVPPPDDAAKRLVLA